MEQTIYLQRKGNIEDMETNNKVELFCHQIIKNEDGSYLVHWGYHNRGSRSLTYASKDCQLIVHQGGTISIPGMVPNVFLPGSHYQCFSTIVTEDTVLTWKVKKNCLQFSVDKFLSNIDKFAFVH